MNDKSNNVRLTERDLKILRFVARHRAVWFEVLHRRFFQGKGPDAVKSTLRRLCGTPPYRRFLKPTRLPDGRSYYQLTYKGTKQIGCSPAMSRPLSPQARASRYAVQWFVFVDGDARRILVNRRNLPDDLSRRTVLQAPFYLEESTLFGVILVDFGFNILRIQHKTHHVLEVVLKHHWFDELISAEAFVLTILTVSESKKRDLVRRLPGYLYLRLKPLLNDLGFDIGKHIRLNVVSVPGLANLIPSRST